MQSSQRTAALFGGRGGGPKEGDRRAGGVRPTTHHAPRRMTNVNNYFHNSCHRFDQHCYIAPLGVELQFVGCSDRTARGGRPRVEIKSGNLLLAPLFFYVCFDYVNRFAYKYTIFYYDSGSFPSRYTFGVDDKTRRSEKFESECPLLGRTCVWGCVRRTWARAGD